MRQTRYSERRDQRGKDKVELLLKALKTANNVQREKAAKALLRSPSQEVVKHMIDLLKSRDAPLRTIALQLLKQRQADGTGLVSALLNEDDPVLRIAGCEILASKNSRDALPLLVRALEDEDPNVRNAACIGLGGFPGDHAVDALRRCLNDEEWIAFSAIYSLGKIGSPNAIPHLWKVFVEREGVLSLAACEVLLAHKDRALSRDVFVVLNGWHEQRRDTFIRTILEGEDTDMLDQLHETMGEELFGHLARHILSQETRSMKLMRFMAKFKRRESCDILLDVLKHTSVDDDDFAELIELFLSLKDVWSGYLTEYLGKEQAGLLPLIRACGLGGQKLSGSRLEEIFVSAPLDLKREIIRNLPDIIEQDGCVILKQALRDEDGHVRGDAALAAARLGVRELTPDVRMLAGCGFLDVRKKALDALFKLDDVQGTEVVETFVTGSSAEDKKVALSVIDRLSRERAFAAMKVLLNDPDEAVLRSAIYVAGNLVDRDERYLEFLNRLLAERLVLHELLKVIREQKLDSFKGKLVELFLDPDRDVWTRYEVLTALAVLRDHSLFDVFTSSLRDENTLIKIGGIKALSDLRDAAAIAHVKPFVKSHDATLRSIATAVLKQLKQVERKSTR